MRIVHIIIKSKHLIAILVGGAVLLAAPASSSAKAQHQASRGTNEPVDSAATITRSERPRVATSVRDHRTPPPVKVRDHRDVRPHQAKEHPGRPKSLQGGVAVSEGTQPRKAPKPVPVMKSNLPSGY